MIRMNINKTLYIVNRNWFFTSILFFAAIALIVMDIRFLPGITATSLIASIFLLIFSKNLKENDIELYKKYESIKDLTNNMFPVTSDIRIVGGSLLSIFGIIIFLIFVNLLPDKIVNMYHYDSFAIYLIVLFLFFIYTVIIWAVYEVLIQLNGYDITKSPYYKYKYEIKKIEYNKVNMLILFVSCSIIVYRIYQLYKIIDSGKKVLFYY